MLQRQTGPLSQSNADPYTNYYSLYKDAYLQWVSVDRSGQSPGWRDCSSWRSTFYRLVERTIHNESHMLLLQYGWLLESLRWLSCQHLAKPAAVVGPAQYPNGHESVMKHMQAVTSNMDFCVQSCYCLSVKEQGQYHQYLCLEQPMLTLVLWSLIAIPGLNCRRSKDRLLSGRKQESQYCCQNWSSALFIAPRSVPHRYHALTRCATPSTSRTRSIVKAHRAKLIHIM